MYFTWFILLIKAKYILIFLFLTRQMDFISFIYLYILLYEYNIMTIDNILSSFVNNMRLYYIINLSLSYLYVCSKQIPIMRKLNRYFKFYEIRFYVSLDNISIHKCINVLFNIRYIAF